MSPLLPDCRIGGIPPAIEDDALGAPTLPVAWAATRFGEYVGWGSTPEMAARSAQLLGMSRCEVEPVPWDDYGPILRRLAHRPWRNERELLESLLSSCLEGAWGGEAEGDALEAALAELDAPPLSLPLN